jgi:uncharacterized protein YeaO (DUF488 family)
MVTGGMARGSRSTTAQVRVRRVYDKPATDDGTRVLVDRLWPRGLSKEAADLDTWLRDVAPSTDLRKWYSHDPAKFGEFSSRYRQELDEPPAVDSLAQLRAMADTGPVTLLTATKDVAHSEAAVLAELLNQAKARS